MTQPSDEVIFDVARNDIGVARQLRASLEVIKSSTSDLDLRKQLDDVLAGRTGMREFSRSEAFAGILDRVPREQRKKSLGLSEDERERLAARGRAELDRLQREGPNSVGVVASPPPKLPPPVPSPESSRTTGGVVPGTRKPNREQIYISDDDLNEDDRYYEEHRRHGWLE